MGIWKPEPEASCHTCTLPGRKKCAPVLLSIFVVLYQHNNTVAITGSVGDWFYALIWFNMGSSTGWFPAKINVALCIANEIQEKVWSILVDYSLKELQLKSEFIWQCTAKKTITHFLKCLYCISGHLPLPLMERPSPQVGNVLYVCIHTGHILTPLHVRAHTHTHKHQSLQRHVVVSVCNRA